jgi:hypothetical protein
MPRTDASRKYAPLIAWLQARPAGQETATLTLAEIEALIGAPLPRGAWLKAIWASSNTARHNWNHAGFRAALDHATRSVHFTRVQA